LFHEPSQGFQSTLGRAHLLLGNLPGTHSKRMTFVIIRQKLQDEWRQSIRLGDAERWQSTRGPRGRIMRR